MKALVAALSALLVLTAAGGSTAQPTAPMPPAPLAASPPTKEASAWWAHIEVLSADDMQGRLAGSPGYQKAADYVADRFRAYGLEPAGTEGYFQPVEFEAQIIDQDRTAVVLTLPDGSVVSGPDTMVLTANTLQPAQVKADLVFIGYGIYLPEAGHDDFAGLDLRGKVAVVLRGGPASLPGPVRAFASAEQLSRKLEEAGAVGLISVVPPGQAETPWARTRASARQPGMYLADPALRRYRAPFFLAQMNPYLAFNLFAGSEHDFAAVTALAASGQPLPRFALKTTIEARVAASISPVRSSNVVAVLPGSDPTLAAEAVVLSGHLDHLGTGPIEPGGDGIFHGVMDNAAGIATLLETARTLQRDKARPKRSIIFLAVTAEEKGLLGSRYFAAHPGVRAGKLVADINIDMFLPLAPLRQMVAHGGDESTLGGHVRAVGAGRGVNIIPDPAPNRFTFIRSDQYSFIRAGVPAVMLDFAPFGPEEERLYADWRLLRYHDQADDLDQPVDLAAAEQFNGFVHDVLLRVADAPERPAWLESSFFKRFEKRP